MIWVITIYLNVETIGGKIITMFIRNKIIFENCVKKETIFGK